MPARCPVSFQTHQFGNNVSHANNKTGRAFRVNFQSFSFHMPTLGRKETLRLSVKGMRIVEKCGSLEDFLKSTPVRRLHPTLQKLKKELDCKKIRSEDSAD